MNLDTAKVGDRFAAITPSTIRIGEAKSAYEYEVVREDGEYLVCYALRNNGTFVTEKLGSRKGENKEFTFDRCATVYEVNAPEIEKAREQIAFANEIFLAKHFLVREDVVFDSEFLGAIVDFKKRIGDKK